jgi:hypothetical protein
LDLPKTRFPSMGLPHWRWTTGWFILANPTRLY